MGNLFPDDPEYPDHQPIPSPATDAADKVAVTSFALAVGLYPLCPVPHRDPLAPPHDHVHLDEFNDESQVVAAPMPSTSGDTPFVPSYDASNDVVRRRVPFQPDSTTMNAAILWFESTQAAQLSTP